MVEIPKAGSRTHLTKPPKKPSPHMTAAYPSEDELVRKIHKKVGGPSKLSTYDDPAHVREVVIRALADEQRTSADVRRVANGDLSAFERRVVRTVTNRGAAVRSRMRQRKELQRLRDELHRKDARLREMEAALLALTSSAAAAPRPHPPPPFPHFVHPATVVAPMPAFAHPVPATSHDLYAAAWMPPVSAPAAQCPAPPSCTTSSSASLSTQTTAADEGALPPVDASLDRDMFGNLIDQLIAPLS